LQMCVDKATVKLSLDDV